MNYDFLIILVAITALMTFGLWRSVNRPKYKQLKKKFRKALWESGPIEPKHNKPTFKPVGFDRTEWTAKFFDEFDDFADVMNWYLADDASWRLQELSDTEVGTAETGPMFGRTYAVFYNQIKVGKLEIHPGSYYGKKDRTITTHVELYWVRLLAYDRLVAFLTGLASHVVDLDKQSGEYVAATNAINTATVKALWEDNYRISEFDLPDNEAVNWGELELYLQGTPTWYFGRRDCEGFAEVKRAGKITDPEWARDKAAAEMRAALATLATQLEKEVKK
jgi:hypothetical protein